MRDWARVTKRSRELEHARIEAMCAALGFSKERDEMEKLIELLAVCTTAFLFAHTFQA